MQDIKWLKQRLSDIEDKWHRLPNFLRVDHAAKRTEVSCDSNSFEGPKEFVTYLNQRWAERPAITPTSSVLPSPTSFGWNNTNVTVGDMWGSSTDTIRQVVYSAFGPSSTGSGTPDIYINRTVV